jgi:hypothetical protein
MALYGPLYRFFHHNEQYFQSVFPDCVDSFSISGHKLFSIPDACGIFISSQKSQAQQWVSYIGAHDTTLSGSRNGRHTLLFNEALKNIGILQEKIRYALKMTDYLVAEMEKAGLECNRLPGGIIVTFPTPSPLICRRYQLACGDGFAHVVCMPHLTTSVIDDFVSDMSLDGKDFTKEDIISNPKFHFRQLTPQHEEQAAQLVTEQFVNNEGLSKSVGLTLEEFSVFGKPLAKRAVEGGLSVVAIDKATQEIAGVSLCISQAKEEEFNKDIEGKLSNKFDPIFDILGSVGEGHHQDNEVHLFTTAVYPKFAGHRLASNLKVAD